MLSMLSLPSRSSRTRRSHKSKLRLHLACSASGTSVVLVDSEPRKLPKVNFHLTRRCNATCGFCFHTALNSFVLPLDEARRGLTLLRERGLRAINFAGGEPFLEMNGLYVGELSRFCKKELGVPHVSIITNGSLVSLDWLETFSPFVDLLGVSVDSFDESVNAGWCREVGLPMKINTVVNALNCHEDMSAGIFAIGPVRWKLLQCLELEGENKGHGALRDASAFTISKPQFDAFVSRHTTSPHFKSLVRTAMPVEENAIMRDSYLLLDERMRFLDCSAGAKTPGESLLGPEGVDGALAHILPRFDAASYAKRGGDWHERLSEKG